MSNKGTILALAISVAAILCSVGLVFHLQSSMQPLDTGFHYQPPRNLRTFELESSHGIPVSNEDFAGHWTLVFFGYTFCPDVCPITTAQLARLLQELDKEGITKKDIEVWFVSVDPERDSPDVIKSYTQHFHPEIKGMTGEPAQLQSFANQLGVVYLRNEQEDGDYSVDHTSSIALVNPRGQYEVLFRPEDKHQYPLDKMLADIKRLL
tara:strand:+ start:382 stop:1005 length:624 start_codon:yes stop_codon:yes gene_type:complete